VRTSALVLAAALLGSGPPVFEIRGKWEELESWIATVCSDPVAILFALGALLLIVALLGAWASTRSSRRREEELEEQTPPAPADEVAIARWVQEGRQLLEVWQERIERLDELQHRLAAMAEEIGQLKARMDGMQAENARLTGENEALVLERDHVQAVLARVGELIQQASETRPRPGGETGP